ncbi:UNKNOWN [Stylonychia lemnae]|uniref:Sfi1 spindle body domain-containing protein n=1 Tax=Stylonychia lemnae TaxID=5949 RepID=A0A078BFB5_STYLE|nr:UNKNOWN [Stylonychia lemnae]|eukprot:CDW91832.1 UNKNOWN [Stylonychia lemnae]
MKPQHQQQSAELRSSSFKPRLRQLDWGGEKQQNENIDPLSDEGNQDSIAMSNYSLSTKYQKKDITKEFLKLHQKMISNKSKRLQTQNIAVPQNRDALLLKYGNLPNKVNNNTRRQGATEEVASYKKDAMKLIINRIYRYIGNIFDDIQKKVMRDDIMRQRKELFDLMKPSLSLAQNQNKESIANNYSILENSNANQQQSKLEDKVSVFRAMFEMKRQRIKDSLMEFDQYVAEDSVQVIQIEQDNQFQVRDNENQEVLHSLYETPGKEETFHVDNITNEQRNFDDSLEENRFKMIQFQDVEGNFESNKKLKPQNNRYNSDEEEIEEEKINESQRIFNEQESQNSVKEFYPTQSFSQANYNFPVIEEQYQESSPSQQNNLTLQEEDYQLYKPKIEEAPIILPAIKKNVGSYLNKNGNEQANQKMIIGYKFNKQPDIVEMSFSENPFFRKHSLDTDEANSSNASNHQNLSGSLQGGQHSPDFKRNFINVQSQSSLLNKTPTLSVKSFISPPTLSRRLDSNNQSDKNSRPKFQDKLKQLLMEQFEGQKLDSIEEEAKQINHIVQADQIIEAHNNSSIIMKLDSQFNDSIKFEAPKQSKLDELKQRLGFSNNQTKSNLLQINIIENIQQDEIPSFCASKNEDSYQQESSQQHFSNSPINNIQSQKDGSINFTEQCEEIIEVQLIQQTDSQFKVNSQRRLNQLKELEDLKNLVDPKDDLKQRIYRQNAEQLIFMVSQVKVKNLKSGFVSLIKRQIEFSKLMHLKKLKQKCLLRQYLRDFKKNLQFSKSMTIMLSSLKKKDITMKDYVLQYFKIWQHIAKIIKEQSYNKKMDQLNNQFGKLSLLIRQKVKLSMKESFDNIKLEYILKRRKYKEEQRELSIQIIQNIFKKKLSKFMNKKFQKFRKITFRIAFDQKMHKMARVLNDRIQFNMKDTIKEIINFCIRKNHYREQVELLNNEYLLQRNKIITSSINRVFKISKSHLQKQGLAGLRQHYNKVQVLSTKLNSMIKVFNKYEKAIQRAEILLMFKQWIKFTQNKNKEVQLKVLSCKKIKAIIKKFNQKTAQQKFDIWQSETQYLIQLEQTKYNNERTLVRNQQVEQLFIDLIWSKLQDGFNQIKLRSITHQKLSKVFKKISYKNQQVAQARNFKKWKDLMIRQKLIRINLTVMIKNKEAKEKDQLQLRFNKWMNIILQKKKAEELLYGVFQKQAVQEEHRLVQMMFEIIQIWKQKIVKQNYMMSMLATIILKTERSQTAYAIRKWRGVSRHMSSQIHGLKNIFKHSAKLKQKAILRNFKSLAQAKSSKILSVHTISKVETDVLIRQVNESFQYIKTFVYQKKIRQQKQKESMKQLIRQLKSINYKQMQRYIIRWKLNTIDSKKQKEKQIIKQQFQKRILSNIIQKQRSNNLQDAFNRLKDYHYCQRAIEQNQSKKIQATCMIYDKLQNVQNHLLNYSLEQLTQHSQEIEQNENVNKAISKMSSVAKIYGYLDKSRKDREFFYRWKNFALRTQAFEFGFQVLNYQYLKHIKGMFDHLNKQSQEILIQKTRQKIGLNLVKMITFKIYKDSLLKAFTQWSLNVQLTIKAEKLKRNLQQPPLPPRIQQNQENSCKKKKSEPMNLFQATSSFSQMPVRLFSNHSKSNSGNNSVASQKNLRYSQQDEEEEDQYYDYEKLNLDTNDQLNNSSEQMILIKPKMSFGGNLGGLGGGRDSLFTHRSTSNGRRNRYDNSLDQCDDFKIAPLGQKNEMLKSNLFQFLQDEKITNLQIDEESASVYGMKQSYQSLKVTESPSKSNQIRQGSTSNNNEKRPVSRNLKSSLTSNHLNKYLSQNSNQKSQSNQKVAKNSVTKSAKNNQTRKSVEKPQLSGAKDDKAKTRITNSQMKRNQNQNQEQHQPQKEQPLLNSNKSQKHIKSPQQSLDPVPEEKSSLAMQLQQRKDQIKEAQLQKKRQSTNKQNNLSNFLNINTRSASRTTQDKKQQKEKSKENNEKFKFFLKQKQTKQQQQNQQQLERQMQQQIQMQTINSNTQIPDRSISSNPLSYTTSMEQFNILSNPQSYMGSNKNLFIVGENLEKGLRKLELFYYKKSLLTIAEFAYSQESNEAYQIKIINKVRHKIQRVIDIKAGLRAKPEYLKQEAFLVWKRLDYLIMLESLHMFNSNISQIYTNNNSVFGGTGNGGSAIINNRYGPIQNQQLNR